jgi:hypothetical protein
VLSPPATVIEATNVACVASDTSNSAPARSVFKTAVWPGEAAWAVPFAENARTVGEISDVTFNLAEPTVTSRDRSNVPGAVPDTICWLTTGHASPSDTPEHCSPCTSALHTASETTVTDAAAERASANDATVASANDPMALPRTPMPVTVGGLCERRVPFA